MRQVYLDNNATTQVAPEVFEAMMPFWSDFYGNPSSMHSFGGKVKQNIDEARAQVAALLGCSADEIVFTSGGSESDNLAIRGTIEALAGRKRHLITTRVEHPAVRGVFHYLQKQGYQLTELPVDSSGALDLDQLAQAITPDTALVSIMWANNETGVIFPIEEIAQIVKSKGVVFHTDAVQAAGKISINLAKTPIDLLSLSGHKIHGPKGVGALFVRRGTKIVPLIIGGHQERGKRAGTENVPGIVGLGKACALALEQMPEENLRINALRNKLEAGILSRCNGVSVNGKIRLPNTLNISFEYVEGEAILLMLDEFGISASSGSACASGSLEPSHVMRAMGVPFTAAHGSIRFSLSRYNTEGEIDYVLEHLPGVIKRLREISPFTQESPWHGSPVHDDHPVAMAKEPLPRFSATTVRPLSLEQAIQTALEFERRVRRIYKEAEEKALDPVGRRIFHVLASEEENHISYLESRLAEWQQTGHVQPAHLQTVIPSEDRIKKGTGQIVARMPDLENRTNELQLLQRALGVEQETSSFYRRMVAELSEEGQQLFARFLEIEDGHMAIVQAEIDSVTGLGFWFDMQEFRLEAG